MLAALAVAAAAGLPIAAAAAQAPARARAQAAVARGSLGDVAVVSASGNADASRSAPTQTPPGISLSSGRASAHASRAGGDARAGATAVARSVDLLGGLVTARLVRRTASDGGTGTVYGGDVRGLAIDGRSIGDIARDASYALRGGGSVVVNRGGVGLRLALTHARNGFPAGTTVTIADVVAQARDAVRALPTPLATPPQAPPAPPPPPAPATPRAEHPRTPTVRTVRPRAARAPSAVRRLSRGDFMFPVAGRTVIGGPFGAARPGGMVHQGNDLFADFGTPVVAVADGTLNRVGTLPISGNRLWLRTARGDAFFYAHLSAFSPNAVAGRHVRKGTVLGYVGNTGDAEPTPPHLHFEIHPDGGPAIDPHAILVAWQSRTAFAPPDTATRPGALVEVRDLIAAG